MNTPDWTPYPHHDFVEAWVGRPIERQRNFDDPAHSDFWRASRNGKIYTVRGYGEDSSERVAPGTAIDITLPVWRVGEGLLFAARLAEVFEEVDAIAVKCRFTGLNDRHLTSLGGNRHMSNDRVSRTPEVAMSAQVTLDRVRDNLTEVMHQLMVPLYERFDFFPLSSELVDQELGRLRGGRF